MNVTFFSSVAYHLFAQAYGCGTYGEDKYNQCATDSSSSGNNTTSTSNKNKSSTSGSSSSDTTGDKQANESNSSTPSDAQDQQTAPQTETSTRPTTLPATVAGKVDSMNWGVLMAIIIGLALLFAFLVLLWKRRHRDQNPPTSGGFTPPSAT